MITHTKKHFLLPLLVLGTAITMAATAQAQDRQYQGQTQDGQFHGSGGVSGSLQINFGTTPRWSGIRGTHVQEIRSGGRSDYDVFRYGRSYYAYNHINTRWYVSRNYRGRFMMIEDRAVPGELRRIPRSHWRNYPVAWNDRGSNGDGDRSGYGDRNGYGDNNRDGDRYRNDNNDGNHDNYGTLQVSFGTSPRWSNISGTRVDEIYGSDRPNYDLFRYGGSYYAYSNSHWYSSSRESGAFAMMDDRSVPTELSRVPRENWRNYPSAWDNQDGNLGGSGDGRRNSRGNNDQRGNRNNGN